MLAGPTFATTFPGLVQEWSPRNDLPPSSYRPKSGKVMWWRCVKAHEWDAKIIERAIGKGCPYCAGKRIDGTNSLAALHPQIAAEWSPENPRTANEHTSGSTHRAMWRCARNPEHQWMTSIANRTRKRSGCPYCMGKAAAAGYNLAIALPGIAAEWSERNPDRPEDVLPQSNRRVWWRCARGHEWDAFVYNRAKGQPCPHCGSRSSRPQRDIADFVTSLGLGVLLDHKGLLTGRQEIDVYIPEKRIGIDYHGLYWHSDELKGHGEHLDRLEAATRSGVRLIQVFESEWLERPEVVRAYVAAILGGTRITVGARATTLVEDAPWAEVAAFLEAHHVQGASRPGTWTGLLRGGDGLPLAAMACRLARGRHAGPKEPRWELTRYCVRSGHLIQGGFQRLWAAFLKHHAPSLVVSFSDRRWSAGDLYRRSGFAHDGVVPPGYWYFRRGTPGPLIHRSLFQRRGIEARLGALLPGETEGVAMARFGYLRIWDAGLDRWAWRREQ